MVIKKTKIKINKYKVLLILKNSNITMADMRRAIKVLHFPKQEEALLLKKYTW